MGEDSPVGGAFQPRPDEATSDHPVGPGKGLPQEETGDPRPPSLVFTRSHCPHCNSTIAWYDNIPPLSWLLLRARCRHGRDIPIAFRPYLAAAGWIAMLWGEPLARIHAIKGTRRLCFPDKTQLYPNCLLHGGHIRGVKNRSPVL